MWIFSPEIKGGKGSFRVHTKDAFACGPGLGVWTGSPGDRSFSEKAKAPLRSLLKDALAFMNRDCTGAFPVCQHLFFRFSGIISPRIIEIARKTPADLGRPRGISACLIYWFLLFLYFPVFSYLCLCSSVFCESIYSLTFSVTVVPAVAMK